MKKIVTFFKKLFCKATCDTCGSIDGCVKHSDCPECNSNPCVCKPKAKVKKYKPKKKKVNINN